MTDSGDLHENVIDGGGGGGGYIFSLVLKQTTPYAMHQALRQPILRIVKFIKTLRH